MSLFKWLQGQYLKSHPLSPLMMHQSTYTPARGLARKRCLLTPHIQFPPSCQALFPPPVALSDRCLGVWSCRLVGISDSLPLDGDLTLDANWIRLVINDKESPESPMVSSLTKQTNSFINIYISQIPFPRSNPTKILLSPGSLEDLLNSSGLHVLFNHVL